MPLIPETDALRLVQAEYREMPGLRLTLEQAQRLWNLDRPTCERTLQALVDRRFLDCTPAGKYVWTGSGSPAQDDFPRRVHAFAATGRA